MECGTSLNLRLRTAARLQDAIRSLGRLRRENGMSEVIVRTEQLLVDTIDGKKPLVLVDRIAKGLKGIAQYNNSAVRMADMLVKEAESEDWSAYWDRHKKRVAERAA